MAVGNNVSEGVKAVVFKRPDSYGIVLISREPVSWQSVVVDLPQAKRGKATCLLMTAGHPFLGNENDHQLGARDTSSGSTMCRVNRSHYRLQFGDGADRAKVVVQV